MKAVVAAFNQEKALVGAFSVIVKTGCGTDGSFYTTKQEEELASQQTLAMAFVTFMNINHARLFLRDHKSSVLNWKRRCQQSSLAMEPRRWRVWFAPPPGDIIWENMSNRHWTLVKKILANLFIFLVAFFLSTPQFIVNQLEPILNALKNLTEHHDDNSTVVL